jgi:hypothetical protein
MKKFKSPKEIYQYAADVNEKAGLVLNKTVTIKHFDGSVLKLTNCKYEVVKDTTWECQILGKDFEVVKTRVGENVHIVWSEHHGYHINYNSDLREIIIEK